MRLQAFAKINLGLDVLGKREDGYHEVRMIMQTIRMYDQLDMRKSVEPGIHLTTNKKYIPVDENNLVWRAAKLMMDTCGIMEGVSIHLHKVIPVAAGMAGGSSDAAATLVGMNRLFHCGLSKEKLMELGVPEGADGSCCEYRGGCSVLCASRNCTGRGNRRKTDGTSADAGLLDTDRKTRDQCIYQICIYNT